MHKLRAHGGMGAGRHGNLSPKGRQYGSWVAWEMFNYQFILILFGFD